jgi:hypothetical protein
MSNMNKLRSTFSLFIIIDTCFKERGLDRIRQSRPLYWLQGLTAGKRYKNRGLDHESVGRQVNQLPNTKKGRVISSALLVRSISLLLIRSSCQTHRHHP